MGLLAVGRKIKRLLIQIAGVVGFPYCNCVLYTTPSWLMKNIFVMVLVYVCAGVTEYLVGMTLPGRVGDVWRMVAGAVVYVLDIW